MKKSHNRNTLKTPGFIFSVDSYSLKGLTNSPIIYTNYILKCDMEMPLRDDCKLVVRWEYTLSITLLSSNEYSNSKIIQQCNKIENENENHNIRNWNHI